jgi:hypothetical protein
LLRNISLWNSSNTTIAVRFVVFFLIKTAVVHFKRLKSKGLSVSVFKTKILVRMVNKLDELLHPVGRKNPSRARGCLNISLKLHS